MLSPRCTNAEPDTHCCSSTLQRGRAAKGRHVCPTHLCAMSRIRVRGTLCVKRSVKDGSRLCRGDKKWVVAGQARGQQLCQGKPVCKDATGELRRQLSNCWHCARRQNCANDGRCPPAGGGPPAPPPGWRGPARQSPTPETCAGQDMCLLKKELPIHLG